MEAPDAAISRSFAIAKWLAIELNELPVTASLRNRLAGACLSITQDHHCAIILLLQHGLNASAFALARLQFESYVRGIWLAQRATDVQVQQYSMGGEPPSMDRMLESLEKLEAYSGGTLSEVKAKSWSNMCSLTHTGSMQANRWLTVDAIEQNYPAEEVAGLARYSACFALLSGVGMATLANNDELGLRIMAKSSVFQNDGSGQQEPSRA